MLCRQHTTHLLLTASWLLFCPVKLRVNHVLLRVRSTSHKYMSYIAMNILTLSLTISPSLPHSPSSCAPRQGYGGHKDGVQDARLVQGDVPRLPALCGRALSRESATNHTCTHLYIHSMLQCAHFFTLNCSHVCICMLVCL